MGGLQSHQRMDYQAESLETDYRGSLRVLTEMLTRQHGAKKPRGKLLFLGLDGAGKSTLVSHLSRISVGDDLSLYTVHGSELPSYLFPEPTRTLQTAAFRMENGERYLQLVDPPGRRNFRAKWYSATGDFSSFGGSSTNLNNLAPTAVATSFQTPLPILAVLFVVDAADRVRFPLVASELVRFLQHKTSHKVFASAPLLLVFNKTDHFLPPLPVETPEEPQSNEYQQLLNNRKQQQRSALRQARRELRKCVDYELTMDARRHPVTKSLTTTSSSSAKSKALPPSFLFAAPVAAAVAELEPPAGLARRHTTSSSTTNSAVSALFTNVVECCAQDRDSVRALRGWLNDELKKAPLSS